MKKLVRSSDGSEVKEGDKLISFRGEEYILEGSREPHKPSSSGFVYVRPVDGEGRREYYVTVFDLEWKDV